MRQTRLNLSNRRLRRAFDLAHVESATTCSHMLRASLVSLVALSAVACAAAPASSSSDSTADLSTEAAADVKVLDDRLVFPRAAVSASTRQRIDAGEKVILTGGRGADAIDAATGQINPNAANPYGFARQAVSYTDEGDTTTVMTTRVALDEAFAQLKPPTALSPAFSHTAQVSVPVIDLSNIELWSNGGASLKLKSGSLTLGSGVDVGTDIDWYKLGQAHVILNTSLDTEIVLEADLDGPTSFSVSKDVYHGSWPIGSIGPVPVTLGLVASVACDIQADGVASATAGIRVSASMKGGVSYDHDSGKSPVNATPQFSASIVDPSFSFQSGSTNTTCHIRPQFSVMLFDAAGPTLTPDLAANFTGGVAAGAPFSGAVTGELGLDVGGKLEVFGKDLGSVDYHLFTVEKQLWSTGE